MESLRDLSILTLPLPSDLPTDSPHQTELLNYLGNPAAPSVPLPVESESSAMEVDTTTLAPVALVVEKAQEKIAGKKAKDAAPEEPLAILPEAHIYVSLLVVLWLLDQGQLDAVSGYVCD